MSFSKLFGFAKDMFRNYIKEKDLCDKFFYFGEFGYFNTIILGTLMSIVLSMLTPTFNEIPKKVIKIKNENLYHLYSVAIFAALYFILLQLNK
jgi:hypothetical protein